MTGHYSWTLERRHKVIAATDVNKLLFQFFGPVILDTATKDQLLYHFKKISVKGLHKEVHRVNFCKVKQDGENVTHFVARLNA